MLKGNAMLCTYRPRQNPFDTNAFVSFRLTRFVSNFFALLWNQCKPWLQRPELSDGLEFDSVKKWQNIDNKGKFSCSYADDGSSSAFTLHLSNRMYARCIQVEMHNRHTAIAKQSLSLAVCICYYDYIFVSCYSVFHLHFFCHSTANVRSFGVERFCLADSCSGFSVLAMFGRYLQHVFLYVISQSILCVSISVCAAFSSSVDFLMELC